MPYITRAARDSVAIRGPLTPGELNYAITVLLDTYVRLKGLSYGSIADVLSACEGAKLEFYRRVAAPYETKKMLENGDVYAQR